MRHNTLHPQRLPYRLLLPVLGVLCLPACGDDGAAEEADSTGAGSTGMTAAPTTDDSTTVTTTTNPTADGSTSQATNDETSTGEPEGSEGEDSSSSSGDPAEACAPELGLYANDDCTTLAEGIEPFEPQYKLWSDGLVKFRYVSLPGAIDSSDADYWSFPVGTVLWKHFETADGARLETRRIEKMSDDVGPGAWAFETFEWNEAGDAVTAVMNGSENVLGTDHDIPAVADCSQCHNGGEGGMGGGGATHDAVLGFSALQLNHDDTDVTLDSLAADGLLTTAVASADAVIPGDATAEAALGVLHANCGHCHGGDTPSGGMRLFVTVGHDAVTQTPTYIDTVGVDIGMSAVMGIPDYRILAGSPADSAVPWRMGQRDGGGMGAAQMPPLATEVVDDEGVAAVDAWINSLPAG
ncbi:MAG: hypothetical protein ACRBN8_19220 [Nannocystales bacterium]